MKRPVRMFAIVEHLRGARGAVPARDLAQALNVAPRTIYRDVAALHHPRLVPVLENPSPSDPAPGPAPRVRRRWPYAR